MVDCAGSIGSGVRGVAVHALAVPSYRYNVIFGAFLSRRNCYYYRIREIIDDPLEALT